MVVQQTIQKLEISILKSDSKPEMVSWVMRSAALAAAPSCPVNMAEGMFTEQTPPFSSCGCWQRLAAIFLKFDFLEISPDFILGKPR